MMQIIGKCEKCGRGFLTLPAEGILTDHYPPERYSYAKPNADGECGGTIKLLNQQSPLREK